MRSCSRMMHALVYDHSGGQLALAKDGAWGGPDFRESCGGGAKCRNFDEICGRSDARAPWRAARALPRAASNFFLDAWSRTLTHPCKPGMEVENDIFIDRLVDELIDKVCIRILKSFSGRLEHDSFQFPCKRVLEC